MGWFGDKTERFRQVPNPYFSMHIIGKFIVAALLIAIPSARIVLRK